MIAPREVRRRHDHEPTHVTVCRRVAKPRAAARTEKPCGAHLRVTHAQRCGCRVWQALRETHHHQVRAHFTPRRTGTCTGILLGGWGDEFEEEVFEVSFVHRDAERACVVAAEKQMRGRWEKGGTGERKVRERTTGFVA
jgi:hypothetical protein